MIQHEEEWINSHQSLHSLTSSDVSRVDLISLPRCWGISLKHLLWFWKQGWSKTSPDRCPRDAENVASSLVQFSSVQLKLEHAESHSDEPHQRSFKRLLIPRVPLLVGKDVRKVFCGKQETSLVLVKVSCTGAGMFVNERLQAQVTHVIQVTTVIAVHRERGREGCMQVGVATPHI